MRNKKFRLIYFITLMIALIFVFFAINRSNRNISISFYHWKSDFSPSKHDLNLLQACEVNQLYLHVFDVDKAPGTQVPIPKAKLSFKSNFPPGIAVIPTVFITQRTFEDAANLNSAELAKNIVDLSRQITSAQKLVWKGFQIDCDWTAGSKKIYFSFLEALKKELGNEIPLSVTIRLHQIKYPEKTGVPPCDRGVLMFYNMGDFKNYSPINSIYDASIAKKYLERLREYPVKLDYALPAFSWAIFYKYGKVEQLLSDRQIPFIQKSGCFIQQGDQLICKQSTLIEGTYFQPGDIVKIEAISPSLCAIAANQIAPHVNSSNFQVIFYHISSIEIQNYATADFQDILHTFN
jgi:hypothetical protein